MLFFPVVEKLLAGRESELGPREDMLLKKKRRGVGGGGEGGKSWQRARCLRVNECAVQSEGGLMHIL